MGGGMGAAGHVSLRPFGGPRARLLHRYAAADGERVVARGARLLLHPHRHHRPLPADARQGRLLPDGLGRQRPARPSAACRTSSASGAIRRCPTTRTSSRRRTRQRRRTSQLQISRRNFVELCHRADQRRRAGVRADSGGTWGYRSTGTRRLHHDLAGIRRRSHSAASCATSPGGEAYLAEAPDPVGRHVPDRGGPGRAGGPGDGRGLSTGIALQLAPSPASPSTSRPPGPSSCRPAWRWSPIPTTSGTSPCSGPP